MDDLKMIAVEELGRCNKCGKDVVCLVPGITSNGILVPEEPTEEMIRAVTGENDSLRLIAIATYKAMIHAHKETNKGVLVPVMMLRNIVNLLMNKQNGIVSPGDDLTSPRMINAIEKLIEATKQENEDD